MAARAILVSAALCVFSAQALVAHQAKPADYTRAVDLLQETCVATMPSFDGVDAIMARKSFTSTGDGAWTSETLFLKADSKQHNNGYKGCMITMRLQARTNELSDTLQSRLSSFGLDALEAKRKGARLSATFDANGDTGTLRVEPLGGRTAALYFGVKPK